MPLNSEYHHKNIYSLFAVQQSTLFIVADLLSIERDNHSIDKMIDMPQID